MTNNTQLPAEVAKKINDTASFHAGHNENEYTTPYRSGFFYGYIKGATEYASKLHQARQLLKGAFIVLEQGPYATDDFLNEIKTFLDAKK